MGGRPRHVIDFHAHAFPEKVAARALSALTETYQVEAHGEATVPGLLRSMDENCVDVSVIAPVATRPDQVRSINDWAAGVQSERIICFGALHPELPAPAGEVGRIVELGLKGVKLQPNFQEFEPDDRRVFPLYRAAEGKLILLFHSGQEIKAAPRIYARPEALARVHRSFPGLTMVIAHMGGYQVWDEVREHLIGENVWLDTSYCGGDLSGSEFLALIRTHGADRIVFGTDYPWGRPGKELDLMAGMGLDEGELEAICWRNAAGLLGLKLG